MTTEDYLGPVNNDLTFQSFGKEDYHKIGYIKIDDVIPNQVELDIECLQRKIKGKGLSFPHVLLYNGKTILMDGHHTVIAKKINGQVRFKSKITIQ